jgi:hypothetical protein
MTPLFKEGGLYTIRRTGRELFEMSIPLPSDADGRTARECPSSDCSPGYFKVKNGTGITENHTAAYCPYCRFSTSPGKFFTTRQLDYAKAVMKREAIGGIEAAVKDALDMGGSGRRTIVDGLIKVELSLISSNPPPVQKPFEQILQRVVVCPDCGLDHALFGLATWCHDCGADIFLTHVEAELAVVGTMLMDVSRRSEQLGKRIAARDIENCLEDVISIYEAVLRAMLVRQLTGTGKTSDEIHGILKDCVRNKLQNIWLSQQVFQELVTIDIFETVSPQQTETLRQIFEKRHPITHNLGVMDKKYLQRVRSAEREGHEVLVNLDEVNAAVSITRDVVTRLHARLFSPSL